MKFLNGIQTLSELKATYRKLSMKFHPDLGGSESEMKALNNEYDIRFEELKFAYNEPLKEDRQTSEMAEDYRNIIEAIITLEGIEIEICGNWIWVSGNTKEHKDTFKSLNFKWAKKKMMWFWRADEYKSYNRKTSSMDDIRSKYGSNGVKTTAKLN